MVSIRVERSGESPRSIRLGGESVTIGRSSTNDIQVPDATLSAQHISLERVDDAWKVSRVSGGGPILLNGAPVDDDGGVWVQISDRLEAGAVVCVLEEERLSALTMEESRSLVREQVAGEGQIDQSPFLEVLKGPELGKRVRLDVNLEQLWVRVDKGCVITSPREAFSAFSVRRIDSRFSVEPRARKVSVNGAPTEISRTLISGDRLECHNWKCIFIDPLQAALDQLDGVETAAGAYQQAIDGSTTGTREGRGATSSGLRILVLILVLVAVGVSIWLFWLVAQSR